MHTEKVSEQYRPAATDADRRRTDDMKALLQGFDEAVEALEAKVAAAKTRGLNQRTPIRPRAG